VRKKPCIVLDTNMLMTIARGINVFEQIEDIIETKPEYIVLTQVMEELEKLAKTGKPSISKPARLALEIVKRYCKIVEAEENDLPTDDLILHYAKEHKCGVATNDKELRRKLREHGIPEIYLREEKMMVDVEGIEY